MDSKSKPFPADPSFKPTPKTGHLDQWHSQRKDRGMHFDLLWWGRERRTGSKVSFVRPNSGLPKLRRTFVIRHHVSLPTVRKVDGTDANKRIIISEQFSQEKVIS